MASRRTLTAQDRALLAEGKEIGGVYIGRGGKGIRPSVWGNPFRIGRDGSREEVVQKFEVLCRKNGKAEEARSLLGK
eukprot:9557112-Lingulodinium_polyedra.AAC.1